MHWLAHFLGTDNLSGAYYGFWSGAGSDIGELGIVAGLGAMIRQRNCEVHGCWRLGRHTTAAGHRVCRRHHPEGHLTAQGVREAHHLYLGKQPGRG
jgi:hypothetical protein